MRGPLSGIKVVEWAMFINGPAAACLLGDLGAEVIKVEAPIVGDAGRGLASLYGSGMSLPSGRSIIFEVPNRNKKDVILNLKHKKGQEILHQLVKRADVFLTNFSEAVATRCGADWPTLSKVNPRIIYASTSGYGSKGPESGKRAFDTVAQARSGFMLSVGDRDNVEPQLVPGSMMDQAGATTLVIGVLAALLARNETEKGQKIEASMLGSAIALQTANVHVALWRGKPFGKHSRREPANPLGNYYCCGDGKWLLLAEPQSDRFWSELCEAVGRQDLIDDPKFNSMKKRERNSELVAILDIVFASKGRDDWVEHFASRDCRFAYSPVLSAEELADDPQVSENQYIIQWDHPVLGNIKTVAPPVSFSETPCGPAREAPEFGQHTEEVLLELGYSWEEMTKLRNSGVF